MVPHNEKNNKLFYYWLIISLGMVVLMVVVGGLTRLTNSGLSITEWELFKGIIPPLSVEAWNNYFSLYKKLPQFRFLYSNMTLDEFKVIFYWEYFHRILGRLIGLFFLIPLVYFYFKKINEKYIGNCLIIFFLILLQGVVGWFMVKSGLTDNTTVSHYRLSLHLFIAFLIISIIFWTILNLKENRNKSFFNKKKENYIFYFLIFLIYIQIIFGAFVSGLDAGKIYQTWPMMNLDYFPNDVLISGLKDLINFDNQSLIQFYHRNIAYFIFFYILILGYFIFKNNNFRLIKPFSYVCFFLFLQMILGIFTLLTKLNIYTALGHQICGLFLTLSVINLYYRYIK